MTTKHTNMPMLLPRDLVRFYKAQSPKAPHECWPWEGSRNAGRCPYGKMNIGYTQLRAHRVAFFLATNIDPGELDVLHTCDNPPCCNPAHLFLGTAADNSRDMVNKGRSPRGLRHGSYTKPESRHFGDKNGLRKHPEAVLRGSRHRQAKLTDSDVLQIRVLYDSGRGPQFINAIFPQVCYGTIKRICARRNWTHI